MYIPNSLSIRKYTLSLPVPDSIPQIFLASRISCIWLENEEENTFDNDNMLQKGFVGLSTFYFKTSERFLMRKICFELTDYDFFNCSYFLCTEDGRCVGCRDRPK